MTYAPITETHARGCNACMCLRIEEICENDRWQTLQTKGRSFVCTR